MRSLHYEAICEMLTERFGEPIGDNQAAPTSTRKKDMGNRGFGSDNLGECDTMPMEIDESELDEVSPPGKEKMVKALKKQPDVKNPWAVAWSSYNKNESLVREERVRKANPESVTQVVRGWYAGNPRVPSTFTNVDDVVSYVLDRMGLTDEYDPPKTRWELAELLKDEGLFTNDREEQLYQLIALPDHD